MKKKVMKTNLGGQINEDGTVTKKKPTHAVTSRTTTA
jgi:hypothetical protein